jgi:hypothetical protein
MPDQPADRLAQTSVPIHPPIAQRWSPRAFDPDAAVIEAVSRGLITHPMAGFDVDGARAAFAIPDQVRPLMVMAVGSLADYARVDPEIAERDAAPRSRKPLSEIAFGASWGQPWR